MHKDLKTCIRELFKEKSSQRELVIHTGMEGLRLIDHAIQVAALRGLLEEKKQEITLEQYNRLIDMLESPDYENLTIAELIINKL
jgi:MinD-like ATPase involved in chromosome partitioning or flagellar assembly